MFEDPEKIGVTTIDQFKKLIWDYYAQNRRSFPWRDEISPYRVFVSEIMLQQTQASRVVDKFAAFIAEFPSFNALADAPFAQVLSLWKGLGYNRRALSLKKAAEIICSEYDGVLCDEESQLVALPGIGKATAASMVAFAFNKPTLFIETNIRTVFINAFFPDRSNVHDGEMMPLVAETIDEKNPREWYYALMDYGVMLKKTVGNASRNSAHYHRQSRFIGSDRQLRGRILEVLLVRKAVDKDQLSGLLDEEPPRVFRMICALRDEGLVVMADNVVRIA